MPNLIIKSVTVSNLGFAAEYNVFGRKNGHLSNEFPIVDSIPDIRLATIVVGRKFSLHHLERALFLRLPKNLRKHTVSCLVTAKKFDLSKFECGGGDVLKRSIESEVEIDNDGEKCPSVIENDVHSNAKHEDVQNAKFGGNCFLYFRNGQIRSENDDPQKLSPPETEDHRNEADGIVEVLNPHTGFILNKNLENDDNTENKDNTKSKSSFVSCISPQALAESFGRNPDYEKKLEEILDYFRMLTPEI